MATRSDWKTLPMPEKRGRLLLSRQYSISEFAQISSGVVPGQMEDKWFMFYEAPWLHVHRSWTGFCIYQVRFEKIESEIVIVEAIVNLDPEQHTGELDATLLGILLDSRAGRDTRSEMIAWVRNLSRSAP